MKRFAILGAVLAVALILVLGSRFTLQSEAQGEAASERTPPGLKKGVKVSVHYSGRDDETWTVTEVKNNWVRIDFQGGSYWANFDNVIYYSFKE